MYALHIKTIVPELFRKINDDATLRISAAALARKVSDKNSKNHPNLVASSSIAKPKVLGAPRVRQCFGGRCQWYERRLDLFLALTLGGSERIEGRTQKVATWTDEILEASRWVVVDIGIKETECLFGWELTRKD